MLGMAWCFETRLQCSLSWSGTWVSVPASWVLGITGLCHCACLDVLFYGILSLKQTIIFYREISYNENFLSQSSHLYLKIVAVRTEDEEPCGSVPTLGWATQAHVCTATKMVYRCLTDLRNSFKLLCYNLSGDYRSISVLYLILLGHRDILFLMD